MSNFKALASKSNARRAIATAYKAVGVEATKEQIESLLQQVDGVWGFDTDAVKAGANAEAATEAFLATAALPTFLEKCEELGLAAGPANTLPPVDESITATVKTAELSAALQHSTNVVTPAAKLEELAQRGRDMKFTNSAREAAVTPFAAFAAKRAALIAPATVHGLLENAGQDQDEEVTPADPASPFGTMAQALRTVADAAPAKAAAAEREVRVCKVEKDRPEQNGIRRPSAGGMCRAVWDKCDELREAGGGHPPEAKAVRAAAEAVGWNMNNAMIEFYQWRKYNGITGRAKKGA